MPHFRLEGHGWGHVGKLGGKLEGGLEEAPFVEGVCGANEEELPFEDAVVHQADGDAFRGVLVEFCFLFVCVCVCVCEEEWREKRGLFMRAVHIGRKGCTWRHIYTHTHTHTMELPSEEFCCVVCHLLSLVCLPSFLYVNNRWSGGPFTFLVCLLSVVQHVVSRKIERETDIHTHTQNSRVAGSGFCWGCCCCCWCLFCG